MSDINQDNFCCSFCKRKKHEVKKMIAGRSISGILTFICDLCTKICYKALEERFENDHLDKQSVYLKPKHIYNELCTTIHGQDRAKKILSVIAYNHLKRIDLNKNKSNNLIEKTNLLFIGNPGCGKTFLIKSLSKILDIPVAIIDATTITSAGYVGEDASTCIVQLLQAANYNVPLAEIGIVFIDEFDKLKKTSIDNGSKDISGICVQQAFLKMIEGTAITVPLNGNKKGIANQESVTVNTENILFICAGSFDGLSKIIERDNSSLGQIFSTNSVKIENLNKNNVSQANIKTEHLIKFGIIPELLSRLHSIVYFDDLSVEDLVAILSKSENSILKQYKRILENKDECILTWDEEVLQIIATECIKTKIGARGLRQIIEKLLMDAMFELPSTLGKKFIHISKENVLNIKPIEIKTSIKTKVKKNIIHNRKPSNKKVLKVAKKLQI